MHTTFHAGRCCALKSLSGLGVDPQALVPAIEKTSFVEPDMSNYHFKTDTRFWNEEAPEESSIARIQRIIEWCKKKRPGMILEAATAHPSSLAKPWSNQDAWIPELQKLGFEQVNEVVNSNTTYLIRVWHLNIAEGRFAKATAA